MIIIFLAGSGWSLANEFDQYLDTNRPSDISDEKWNSLKSVVQETRITSMDGVEDLFGQSIDFDPDTGHAVIGAPSNSDNGAFAGAVYVFESIGTGWQQMAKLVSTNEVEFQMFGNSVAIDNNRVFVGAPKNSTNDVGKVYIYELIGQNWVLNTELTSPLADNVNNFGFSIDVLDDRLAVSDTLANSFGAIFVFDYDNNTSQWNVSEVHATDGNITDTFGYSISLNSSGDKMAVGASNANGTNGSQLGAVYVFEYINSSWMQVAILTGSDSVMNTQLGIRVAIDGDTVISSGNLNVSNSVYVFELISGVWQETAILTGPNVFFGSAIEIKYGQIFIGTSSPNELRIYDKVNNIWEIEQTINNFNNIGAISVKFNEMMFSYLQGNINDYELGSPGCMTQCEWHAQSEFYHDDTTLGDGFGISISLSGDRAVIGAYQDDDNGIDAGAAYIFEYKRPNISPNSPKSWRIVKKLTAEDGSAGDSFGRSVAIDGDRVIVGAPLDNTVQAGVFEDTGAVYVFELQRGGWIQTDKLLSGEGPLFSEGDLFGFSIDLFGDRILVGAHADDNNNGDDAGAAYIFDYDLKNETWGIPLKLSPNTLDANDAFGFSVDLDEQQAIIGAYRDGISDTGTAYIYSHVLFPNDSWIVNEILLPTNSNPNDLFGTAVAISGDHALVGDQSADLLTLKNTGKAYFYTRSTAGWSLPQVVFNSGAAAGDRFGYSVSLLGNQALIGAWFDDTPSGADTGSAYKFEYNNSLGLWQEKYQITDSNSLSQDYFGVSVALGENWIMAGAHRDDSPHLNSGSAYVYLSSDVIFFNGFE